MTRYKNSLKLKIYSSKYGNHAQVTLIELSINCSRLDVKQRLGRVQRKFNEKLTKSIKINTVIKHYLSISDREVNRTMIGIYEVLKTMWIDRLHRQVIVSLC